MLRFTFRLFRNLMLAATAVAVGAKFLLESNADPETEEIDLVSIYQGTHLVSKAETFYGGNILSMFAGTLLDLRNVQPSPTGVKIDLRMAMAGLSIVVPEGWRVHNESTIIMAGFSDATTTDADEEAPTLTLTGFALMAGVQVGNKSPVPETA